MPRKRECGKVQHFSKSEALAARKKMKLYTATLAHPYVCKICGAKLKRQVWHLGHKHFNRFGKKRPGRMLYGK